MLGKIFGVGLGWILGGGPIGAIIGLAIITNVINFASKVKNFDAKIAILSATEEILDQMESSSDAYKLMKWSKI